MSPKLIDIPFPVMKYIAHFDEEGKFSRNVKVPDFAGQEAIMIRGEEFRGVSIIVGEPGSGKSTAFEQFPEEVELLALGENIQWAEAVGYPSNISNLIAGLELATSQILLIDSITAIDTGVSTRLGSKGIDLVIFNMLAELNYLATVNNLVIFCVFNPILPEIFPVAVKEAIAKSSLVIKMQNYQASITDTKTRKFVETVSNKDLYNALFLGEERINPTTDALQEGIIS